MAAAANSGDPAYSSDPVLCRSQHADVKTSDSAGVTSAQIHQADTNLMKTEKGRRKCIALWEGHEK